MEKYEKPCMEIVEIEEEVMTSHHPYPCEDMPLCQGGDSTS